MNRDRVKKSSVWWYREPLGGADAFVIFEVIDIDERTGEVQLRIASPVYRDGLLQCLSAREAMGLPTVLHLFHVTKEMAEKSKLAAEKAVRAGRAAPKVLVEDDCYANIAWTCWDVMDSLVMDSFDAEERAREKQAARDEDAAALLRGETIRDKNGAFAVFAHAPIDFSKLPKRAR